MSDANSLQMLRSYGVYCSMGDCETVLEDNSGITEEELIVIISKYENSLD